MHTSVSALCETVSADVYALVVAAVLILYEQWMKNEYLLTTVYMSGSRSFTAQGENVFQSGYVFC